MLNEMVINLILTLRCCLWSFMTMLNDVVIDLNKIQYTDRISFGIMLN